MLVKTKFIGKCIYCGSLEDLTNEHALPKALKGQWVLQKASCSSCSKYTSKIERNVLRGVYYSARLRYGLKGYRSLPVEYTVEGIDSKGSKVSKTVSVKKYGAVITLLGYKQPEYLTGVTDRTGIAVVSSYLLRTNGMDLSALAKELDLQQITFTEAYEGHNFEKFLCKVAYSFAVFAYGLDSFERVYILDSLFDRKDDIGLWVGSTEAEIGEADTHIELFEKGMDLICKIRIFGKLPVPTYLVVVGRLQ